MKRQGGFLIVAFIAAACSAVEPPASDMPLRTVGALVDDAALRDAVDSECRKWKASATPVAAIPTVVVANCANLGEARGRLWRAGRRVK